MKTPVIAIGLDAAEPSLLEKWMDEGHLKTMAKLREQGAYGRLENFAAFSAETPWTTFATGCQPQETGYWSPLRLRKNSYTMETRAAYEYDEFPPFYALGDNYRIAAFDVPQVRASSHINGLQITAWGAHSPQIPSGSRPESAFQDIVNTYGAHPGLHKDYAVCLDLPSTVKLQEVLTEGIRRRAEICQAILEQEPWDLFITVFGEAHSAGHNFWHISQPDHPLYEKFSSQAPDLMLKTFQEIDAAIERIISKAPRNANIVIFSAHGMGSNTMDLPSTTFLPEFLYRWSFPGQQALFINQPGEPLPPVITKMKCSHWERHIWGTKKDTNPVRKFLRRNLHNRLFRPIERVIDNFQGDDLVSPFQLEKKTDVVPQQPASWYAPLWPKMKAFALPSFSEGYIRINLQGRDPQGFVTPEEYDDVCKELIEQIHALKDGRKGIPMAKEVIRTRQSPFDNDPKLPDADIVIVWQDEYATDVIESPQLGRIGPAPHYRAGSHRHVGFMLVTGDDIAPGQTIEDGHALDIPPTILHLMGVTVPEHLEGKLLSIKSSVAVD